MYNDFIIIGPTADPAGIKGMKDVSTALAKIVDTKAGFISRGDYSGTDQMGKRTGTSSAASRPVPPIFPPA